VREPMTGNWHTCPICGEDFHALGCWIFTITKKGRRIYYCSRTCKKQAEERGRAVLSREALEVITEVTWE